MDPGLLAGEIAGCAAALEAVRRWVIAPAWRAGRRVRAQYDELHGATVSIAALQPQVVELVEHSNALAEDMRELSGSLVSWVVSNDRRIADVEGRVIINGPRRMDEAERQLAQIVDELSQLHTTQTELARRTSALERWLARRRATDEVLDQT